MGYIILPCGRTYWIERIEDDGSRIRLEQFRTEDMAVQRLRLLQQRADEIERREKTALPLKVRL